MKHEHATVEKDGYKVPLIGVDRAAVLEECDCCHDEYGVSETEYNGVQFLCNKCRPQNVPAIEVSCRCGGKRVRNESETP